MPPRADRVTGRSAGDTGAPAGRAGRPHAEGRGRVGLHARRTDLHDRPRWPRGDRATLLRWRAVGWA